MLPFFKRRYYFPGQDFVCFARNIRTGGDSTIMIGNAIAYATIQLCIQLEIWTTKPALTKVFTPVIINVIVPTMITANDAFAPLDESIIESPQSIKSRNEGQNRMLLCLLFIHKCIGK